MNWGDLDILNNETLRIKRKADGVYSVNYQEDIDNPDPNGPRINGEHWFENKEAQINWYTDPWLRRKRFSYYEKVDPLIVSNRPFPRLNRSSYVPYIKTRSGKRYWLLGSFHDMPEIKTDFGGRCYEWDKIKNQRIKQEKYAINCATRELKEETHGVLTKPILDTAKNDKKVTTYKGTDKRDGAKTIFTFVNMSDYFFDYPQPKTVQPWKQKTFQPATDPFGNQIPIPETMGDYDQLFLAESKLKDIQDEINRKAKESTEKENFGPLGFYAQDDILSGKVLTAFSLTDFINNVKK